MAKTSRMSRTRAGTARETTRRAARRARAGIEAPRDDEAQIDGCDVEFKQSEVTADAELPASKGGVEPLPGTQRRTADRAKRDRPQQHRRRRAR